MLTKGEAYQTDNATLEKLSKGWFNNCINNLLQNWHDNLIGIISYKITLTLSIFQIYFKKFKLHLIKQFLLLLLKAFLYRAQLSVKFFYIIYAHFPTRQRSLHISYEILIFIEIAYTFIVNTYLVQKLYLAAG